MRARAFFLSSQLGGNRECAPPRPGGCAAFSTFQHMGGICKDNLDRREERLEMPGFYLDRIREKAGVGNWNLVNSWAFYLSPSFSFFQFSPLNSIVTPHNIRERKKSVLFRNFALLSPIPPLCTSLTGQTLFGSLGTGESFLFSNTGKAA